jgi:prepilin-type N-terminal cleavage/methylation domain-containing protein
MQASPQSNPEKPVRRGCFSPRAFTLIELIFVLALLAISAIFVASSMGGFFRGRALNFEARRLLSLTHYGQSRAVAEGVPVLLWINPKNSTYGLMVQSGYVENDARASTFTADPSLTLDAPTADVLPTSESDDEKLGVPEELQTIRFNPDGFFDDSSIRKIVIHQNSEAALELVQTANRLGYEIRPGTLD